MTVIEHLEELRRVLIISLIAWGVATVIGFAISQPVLGILLGPVHKVIGNQKLIYPGPVDGFLLFFKIGIFTGFILSSPIILWQVWSFIAPGLHRNERRFAVGFIGSAIVLFAMASACTPQGPLVRAAASPSPTPSIVHEERRGRGDDSRLRARPPSLWGPLWPLRRARHRVGAVRMWSEATWSPRQRCGSVRNLRHISSDHGRAYFFLAAR